MKSKYVNQLYVLSYQKEIVPQGIQWIDRNIIIDVDKLGVDELMQKALFIIESQSIYPQALLYVNYDYLARPSGIYDQLIIDSQYKGYDTVFPGLVDYGHYWFHSENNEFKQTDPSLKGRIERKPVFRALYGLGCLSSTHMVRTGQMIAGKIGILPIDDLRYTFRHRDLEDGVMDVLDQYR